MLQSTFRQQLQKAIPMVLQHTAKWCSNKFPPAIRYIVQPTGREPHNGMDAFETERLHRINTLKNKLLTEDEVVELLGSDDGVPLYIDTTIYRTTILPRRTIMHLWCSRRTQLPHAPVAYEGIFAVPPFNVSMRFPVGYNLDAPIRKFHINHTYRPDVDCRGWIVYYAPPERK